MAKKISKTVTVEETPLGGFKPPTRMQINGKRHRLALQVPKGPKPLVEAKAQAQVAARDIPNSKLVRFRAAQFGGSRNPRVTGFAIYEPS